VVGEAVVVRNLYQVGVVVMVQENKLGIEMQVQGRVLWIHICDALAELEKDLLIRNRCA